MQNVVHAADCILLLGTVLSDIDVATTTLDEGRANSLTADRIAIRRHRYDNVRFADFLAALADAPELPRFGASPPPLSSSLMSTPS